MLAARLVVVGVGEPRDLEGHRIRSAGRFPGPRRPHEERDGRRRKNQSNDKTKPATHSIFSHYSIAAADASPPHAMTCLTYATRRSPLALAQSRAFAKRLVAAAADSALEIRELHVVTTGDRIVDQPLAPIGGKGLFVKE